jgi:glycosyltransferase involved in cell wall biosynthesis
MEEATISNPPIYVVIPARNEQQSIAAVIQNVFKHFPDARLVVVDDGSTDHTASRAAAAGATVVKHPFNAGYGVSFHTGLIWAKRQNASVVVTLDGDGQHDPQSIPALAAPVLAGQADLSLGSRYLRDSISYRPARSRRLGSWLFAQVISLLTRKRFTDPTTGFQCMNAKVLDLYVNLHDFPEKTPDADMVLHMHFKGCRIVEVPVTMHEDQGNESMHGTFKSMFYAPKMLLAIVGVVLARVSWGVGRP